MIHTIEVENIKCGGCMSSIKDSLAKLPGVVSVAVSKEQEAVTVDGDVEREVITKKLADLGYPEKGNNDIFKKAKSFVSCAIGNLKS